MKFKVTVKELNRFFRDRGSAISIVGEDIELEGKPVRCESSKHERARGICFTCLEEKIFEKPKSIEEINNEGRFGIGELKIIEKLNELIREHNKKIQ